MLKRSF